MSDWKCEICGSQNGYNRHLVREMHFGTREEFAYHECHNCGCLQIDNIPNDLGRYYPENYYSYSSPKQKGRKSLAWHYSLFKSLPLRPRSPLGKLLKIPSHYSWFRHIPHGREARVLDIGGGSGSLLWRMHASGFKNLTCIDPFLPADQISPEVSVLKGDTSRLTEGFDVIMSHHSFEHVPDPKRLLREMRRLLNPQGVVLIRIPLMGQAWKTYGTSWAGIDAPRHLFLHTKKSMIQLCESEGFKVERVEFDGTDFDYWASEQYERDLPLNDKRSYALGRKGSVFNRSQILNFRKKALAANRSGEGDSAAFFLS